MTKLKSLSGVASAVSLALISIGLAVTPAGATNNAPFEPRLSTVVTTSETGSGSSRTVSYTVTITDTDGALIVGSPTGNQIQVMGMVLFMCATQQPASSVGFVTPQGCTFFSSSASTNSGTASTRTYTRSYVGSNIDNNLSSYPFITPTLHVRDESGNQLALHGNSSGSSVVTPAPSTPTPSKYEGPEILAVDVFRPIVAGGKLTFTGNNLSSVTSATIGAKSASLSFDAGTGLSIGTPSGLEPGKYDLVMQSSFGKLTHINAVTIKAPTPTVTIGFRSDAEHLNEKQVLDLVAFNKTLNPDYEKVRCIVNASDPKTAQRIADLVCAQVARGEARNVEVIKDVRTSYLGEGFWVRVYAAG